MQISAIDSEDLPTNLTQNEHFQNVVNRAVNRRGFLKFGSGAAVATFLAGPLAACGGSDNESVASLLGFKALAASSADTVVVAEGYTATAFVPWGTPLFSTGAGSTWSGNGTESAADQARQVGDNHDGIHFFPINGTSSSEGLLVMNHEYNTTLAPAYTDYLTLFGPTPAPANTLERVNKAINSWGCSVLHIKKTAGTWALVTDSVYNRRITAATPMLLTGPAAGDDKLKTSADTTGTDVLGTINNCGNGYTPWGTYLTCEENFNNNFGTTVDPTVDGRTVSMKRYGITKTRPVMRGRYNTPGSITKSSPTSRTVLVGLLRSIHLIPPLNPKNALRWVASSMKMPLTPLPKTNVWWSTWAMTRPMTTSTNLSRPMRTSKAISVPMPTCSTAASCMWPSSTMEPPQAISWALANGLN